MTAIYEAQVDINWAELEFCFAANRTCSIWREALSEPRSRLSGKKLFVVVVAGYENPGQNRTPFLPGA